MGIVASGICLDRTFLEKEGSELAGYREMELKNWSKAVCIANCDKAATPIRFLDKGHFRRGWKN